MKSFFKHPFVLAIASLIAFVWCTTWFVGGPFGLTGIDPIILYQTGFLETSEQLALQYLKFYSGPFILLGSALILLVATTRSVARIRGKKNRNVAGAV